MSSNDLLHQTLSFNSLQNLLLQTDEVPQLFLQAWTELHRPQVLCLEDRVRVGTYRHVAVVIKPLFQTGVSSLCETEESCVRTPQGDQKPADDSHCSDPRGPTLPWERPRASSPNPSLKPLMSWDPGSLLSWGWLQVHVEHHLPTFSFFLVFMFVNKLISKISPTNNISTSTVQVSHPIKNE